MADQKRWFKVWVSIATDPSFLDCTLSDIGRWVLLGSWIAEHGKKGKIVASLNAFRHRLKIDNGDDTKNVISRLPNVYFGDDENDNSRDDENDNSRDDENDNSRDDENDNGKITVIIKNWAKYQMDSTGYERLKRWRKKQMITVQENIREEKRRKEKNKPPISPLKRGNILLLPDWVNREAWDGFVEMRKKIKKPLTDRAMNLALKDLEKLRLEGHNPIEVLNQSTKNCWQGLFPIKEQINTKKHTEVVL